ncbi:MAG: 7-cyano-7-deazaguanine synthase [Christensenellaceae bacterium]|jgi:7-cyano-7-deazaguanine synthase in queuosine biosynthesis|nr:7-cyano-7-deazaguanine synthase [Christensenellaceae bacterium]
MSSLLAYSNELLKKRGWISKIPESKKAVMLVSGGYDSIVTAARLIKDYGMELYPVYIDRGARNREGELSSIEFYTKYLRKEFGKGKFHDVLIPAITIPPKEIKEQLQEYSKTRRYPMRDFIMIMFAAQYAASLGEDVKTICTGFLATDRANITVHRINTLAICEMTKEPEWNILSINVDPEISDKLFGKHDEIMWAHANNFPDEHTMTCWTPVKVDGKLYHCGECYACEQRQLGFKNANIKDKAKYYKKGEKQ